MLALNRCFLARVFPVFHQQIFQSFRLFSLQLFPHADLGFFADEAAALVVELALELPTFALLREPMTSPFQHSQQRFLLCLLLLFCVAFLIRRRLLLP